MALLVLSQLPLNYQDTHNRTSKIHSLMAVDQQSGAKLWGDLIASIEDIQNNYPIRRIVTDQMTRFVLYTATRGQIYWWQEYEYFPKHRDDYQEDFLTSDFSDSLLVINKRNGTMTNSARYAGHWPPNVLNVAQYYPQDLDLFIAKHPEHFDLLWSNDNSKVFLMQPTK